MKNIKFLFLFALLSAFFACQEPKPEPTTEEIAETTGKAVRSIKDAFNKGYADISKNDSSKVVAHPFANPVLIYGSSFGEFFQVLYKQNKIEDMMKFTSSKSIEKFGYKKVYDFYKKMDFAYEIKLKSENKVIDITTLNYEAGIMATRNMLRMDVVLENDSCKILLNNIKSLR